IGMALLCMAGQAYSADIIVTTTEDIEKDDKECSLREAVGYINRGLARSEERRVGKECRSRGVADHPERNGERVPRARPLLQGHRRSGPADPVRLFFSKQKTAYEIFT